MGSTNSSMRLGKASMARLPSVKAKLFYNFTSAMVMHPLQTLGLWMREGDQLFMLKIFSGMGLFSIELNNCVQAPPTEDFALSANVISHRVLPLAFVKCEPLGNPEVTT